jgi:hypothetical protein
MTVQHLWELLKVDMPSMGETMAVALLDSAQKTFCDETSVLQKEYDLPLTTAMTYALPDDFGTLVHIRVMDDEKNGLEGILFSIDFDADAPSITFVDQSDPTATTLSTDVDSITIIYSAVPDTLSSLTDTPTIPEQFHLALVYEVKMALGGDSLKYQQAERQFTSMRVNAKRYGNTRRTRISTRVQQEGL